MKNAHGDWAAVELRENEVLVVFGATAAHVSGGVFAPGAYRVVGDLFAGRGRWEVALELRPQPSASLNFAAALREAGHSVSRRCLRDCGRFSFIRQRG